MKRGERLRLNDRILILTLLVNVTLLANQLFTLGIYAGQTFQGSMIPAPGGEELKVSIETDTGRPKGILDQVARYLRRQPWLTSSWVGAWLVDGQERTEATVSISISVTGGNVASTATVDYWIEGRPQGGGTPYRFLEATGQSVTVGGAALEDSSNLGIVAHLEAMGLSTDQSWTVDYYVYTKALATGSISSETLTNEISETNFDTKTYELYDPGTWTVMDTMKSTGMAGFVSGSTWYAVATDYDTRYFRLGGGYPGSVWSFQNYGLSGTPPLPYVDPGTLVIEEAYIQFPAAQTGPNSAIAIYMWASGNYQGNYITTYTGISDSYTYRRAQCYAGSVTYNPPWLIANTFYNSTDVKTLIQTWSEQFRWSNGGCVCFFLDIGSPNNGEMRFYPWPAKGGRLFVRWSGYTASWYPLPPLSLADTPITLDVVALSALMGAVALAWRENRRKMS